MDVVRDRRSALGCADRGVRSDARRAGQRPATERRCPQVGPQSVALDADRRSLPNLTSFTDLSETTQAARIRNSPVRYYETSTTHAPEIVGGAFAAGMWGVNRAAHPFASAPEPNLAALEQLLDDPTALTALTELNLRRAHEPYYYQPWRLEDHVDGLIDRLSRRGASLFINGSETVAEAGTE